MIWMLFLFSFGICLQFIRFVLSHKELEQYAERKLDFAADRSYWVYKFLQANSLAMVGRD